jgi:type II secretory pathway pseudopilin PulG
MISTAGAVLLAQTARISGLERHLSTSMQPWTGPRATHDPAKILLDLAITVALGGDCAADIAVLRAQPGVFGAVASDPTVSRAIDTLAAADADVLTAIRAARAAARAWVWHRAGAPTQNGWIVLDPDATVLISHSEKEDATKTWKKTSGFTRCWCSAITASTAPENPSPGCCGAVTPVPTPPPTTSPCWTRPWPRYRPTCANLMTRGG